MNAAIDIGNTRCKIGFFENDSLQRVVKNIAVEEISKHIIGEEIPQTIISSVGKEAGELVDQIKNYSNVLLLSHQTPLPITLDYATPGTLGTDRIAAAVGAFHLNPGYNCLVIDIGSCITYDVVSKEGTYEGGAISPGVEMKLKAMHSFTARLPLIEVPEWMDLPGKTTASSMINGALYGTLSEIEGMAERFSSLYGGLHVIICGGGSKFFESNIKRPIFACSELVLIGLNRILMHNDRN